MAKPLNIWRVIQEQTDGSGNTAIKVVQDEAATVELLRNQQYKGRKVVIICIAGQSRLGKSFLLNCFLKYLKNGRTIESDEPLKGFAWGNSANPMTRGIQIWSEPLPITLPDGEQAVVLLMDTEGVFDMESSTAGCSKLSAIAAYLSSMLIYNVRSRFQSNDFGYLRYFTTYGRLATQGGSGENALCQQLTFLVRDWSNPGNYKFGREGGKSYLEHHMKEQAGANSELNETKRYLKHAFSELNCYLMPQPDRHVTEDADFVGRWSEMSGNFTTYLQDFIGDFLSANSVQVKRIHGHVIRWEHLPCLFKSIDQAFKDNNLPEAGDLFAASTAFIMKLVIESCTKLYNDEMVKVTRQNEANLHVQAFREAHQNAKNKAFQLLSSKVPGDQLEQWRKTLELEILKSYDVILLNVLPKLSKRIDAKRREYDAVTKKLEENSKRSKENARKMQEACDAIRK